MCGANLARKFAGVQAERRLHDELGKNPGKIGIQRDPPFADLCRAVCLPQIDAGVDRFGILCRHPPEGVFDNDRGVETDAQFQKEDLLSLAGAEEATVPLRCSVPALVLHKGIVTAEIHGHRPAADRAVRDQFRGNCHVRRYALRDSQAVIPADDIALRFQHLPDEIFVFVSLLTARLAALEQAVIPLRIEKAFFIKARFLETVVYIGGQDEIVLALYLLPQIVIYRLGRILIAVDPDIAAPVSPTLFRRIVGVEPPPEYISWKPYFFSKSEKYRANRSPL